MTLPDTKLVEQLRRREHYFRNASEGEYDADLLQSARLEIERLTTDLTAMTAERDRMREALRHSQGRFLNINICLSSGGSKREAIEIADVGEDAIKMCLERLSGDTNG